MILTQLPQNEEAVATNASFIEKV